MTMVQFFVRLLSGKTIVLFANSTDTIRSVLEKIQSRTGMPKIMIYTTSLVYRGKQLQLEQTLEQCGVGNDSDLKLVTLMQSKKHPRAWRLINDDLVPYVLSLCKKPALEETPILVLDKLYEFNNAWAEANYAESHLEIFRNSSAVKALVKLYKSSHEHVANEAITLFVDSINYHSMFLPESTRNQCVLIVLELCKLLGMNAGSSDSLYKFCRNSLRAMVIGDEYSFKKGLLGIQKIFPYAQELAIKISRELGSAFLGLAPKDVSDFKAIVLTLAKESKGTPANYSRRNVPSDLRAYHKMIGYFRGVFFDLLDGFDKSLKRAEEGMDSKSNEVDSLSYNLWDQLDKSITLSNYLPILNQLNMFSKQYFGYNKIFRDTMKRRKKAISYLVVKFSKRYTDNDWIFDCKELMDFEAKKHLALLMLPDLDSINTRVNPFSMLISRAHLLKQSFEYIAHADPESLRVGLNIEFRREKGRGDGVEREWFVLVCEEIFNPGNALFVACPNDRRRFLPNPASDVNSRHLRYFRFCGRVIALALMRSIHLGIVLDRTLVLQLAGKTISLEDIQDADPFLYRSCKQILEMNAEVVDQDALGLTFVHEFEEFGERKSVELCADGKSKVVNSMNRRQYVESLIQHRFVTSIAEQVEQFTTGFADIASSRLTKTFFEWLDPKDFERMLCGSENSISVDDWRAHTDCQGFKSTDARINWFWEIVGSMTHEQKKALLFFWTSIKYLPVEGFRGLESRLQIRRIRARFGRLPTSHTCMYLFCLPSYPSLSVTRDRLNIITQEHVGCSFGTL